MIADLQIEMKEAFDSKGSSTTVQAQPTQGQFKLFIRSNQLLKQQYILNPHPQIVNLLLQTSYCRWSTLLTISKMLPNLKYVSINCWKYNDSFLQNKQIIQKWTNLYPKLKHLELTDCYLQNEALQIIVANLPQLLHLNITRNQASIQILKSIAKYNKKLKELRAKDLYQSDNNCFQCLQQLATLQLFAVGATGLSFLGKISNQPFFVLTNQKISSLFCNISPFKHLKTLQLQTKCHNVLPICKLRNLQKLIIRNKQVLPIINISKIIRNIKGIDLQVNFKDAFNYQNYVEELKVLKKKLCFNKTIILQNGPV